MVGRIRPKFIRNLAFQVSDLSISLRLHLSLSLSLALLKQKNKKPINFIKALVLVA